MTPVAAPRLMPSSVIRLLFWIEIELEACKPVVNDRPCRFGMPCQSRASTVVRDGKFKVIKSNAFVTVNEPAITFRTSPDKDVISVMSVATKLPDISWTPSILMSSVVDVAMAMLPENVLHVESALA